MKDIFVALAILILLFPWLMRSLADGSINLNGLTVNLIETAIELVTRQPSSWTPPETRQPEAPNPTQRNEGGL